MSRYTGPKARHCRRFGVNIYGADKYDKILAKRDYPPGLHGKTQFSKKTEFRKQLEEKQKARFMFGISEKQFRNYYVKADKSSAITGDELLRLLEKRLDNVLYRSGFANTRAQARQMVSHGLALLNKTRVTIPSQQIKIGDKIEIRPQNLESPLFAILKSGKKKINPARWLTVDPKNLTIEILSLPEVDDLEKSIESHLIVEFYSKS
ncbi:MAG: 30S ribosomal protein S4, small subunit ribosomal protein S4 [Candidatus Peregrinibacteria bacterium GW2011_GWE2_39_6]|nr:MAG: 30S ribosomal protein S4, small subunit ribosomal protein S4 [Candidatus Peregrinibacteria bacterium GW2011_GWF2_39_17]KKR26115.1 MAG: 30S ribosomal protein S4, small subunit ribosomal protein S4 [Candidatus Peregrinibacteria bacterium GW2011_GWE2_39_6]HCW32700.1 30S ribosomal protein S4 [Candidatus Peregrinibacteria bacterium]